MKYIAPVLLAAGFSSISASQLYYDPRSGNLNLQGRDIFCGDIDGACKSCTICTAGDDGSCVPVPVDPGCVKEDNSCEKGEVEGSLQCKIDRALLSIEPARRDSPHGTPGQLYCGDQENCTSCSMCRAAEDDGRCLLVQDCPSYDNSCWKLDGEDGLHCYNTVSTEQNLAMEIQPTALNSASASEPTQEPILVPTINATCALGTSSCWGYFSENNKYCPDCALAIGTKDGQCKPIKCPNADGILDQPHSCTIHAGNSASCVGNPGRETAPKEPHENEGSIPEGATCKAGSQRCSSIEGKCKNCAILSGLDDDKCTILEMCVQTDNSCIATNDSQMPKCDYDLVPEHEDNQYIDPLSNCTVGRSTCLPLKGFCEDCVVAGGDSDSKCKVLESCAKEDGSCSQDTINQARCFKPASGASSLSASMSLVVLAVLYTLL